MLSLTESQNGQTRKGPRSLGDWSSPPAPAGSVLEHAVRDCVLTGLGYLQGGEPSVSLGGLGVIQFIQVIFLKEISSPRVK